MYKVREGEKIKREHSTAVDTNSRQHTANKLALIVINHSTLPFLVMQVQSYYRHLINRLMSSLFNPSLQVWEYLYQRFSESLPLTLGLILIWHQLSVPRWMAHQRRLSVEVPLPLSLCYDSRDTSYSPATDLLESLDIGSHPHSPALRYGPSRRVESRISFVGY